MDTIVSIQPLLLFIIRSKRSFLLTCRFNTTFVTVYLTWIKQARSKKKSFNTTFVTVYQSMGFKVDTVPGFQYNLCYCLSSSTCRSEPLIIRFNTTFVTVYQKLHQCPERNRLFQYNLCYCLSASYRRRRNVRRKFQYNLCYCLSE